MNLYRRFLPDLLVYVAPVFVIFAQIPYFRGNIVSRVFSFVGLFLALLYILIKRIRVDLSKYTTILVLTVVLLLFSVTCCILTGESFYFSTTITSILITVATFIVFSVIFSSSKTTVNLSIFIEFIILSISILSIFIFVFLINQGFSFFGRYYYYGESKNLVAFIVAFGSILQLMMLKYKKLRLLHLLEFLFCSYVEIMLKSRTSLICWIVGVFLVVLLFFKNHKIKIIFLASVIIFLIVVLTVKPVYELVVNNIFAAGRNLNDLNDLTSGRMVGFLLSYRLFESSPFIGVGNNYIDNNILMWLSQHGVIGFLIIVSIAICLISKIRLCYARDFKIMLAIIFIMLLVNGLMESYSPFGPGTKVFCCWALLAACENYKIQDLSKGF